MHALLLPLEITLITSQHFTRWLENDGRVPFLHFLWTERPIFCNSTTDIVQKLQTF